MAKFVRIMGDDPGDTADVTSGRLNTDTEFTGTITVGEVRGTVADGVAPDANPVLVAGYDGTLTQTILTDSTGASIVVGAGADGVAVVGNPVLIAGEGPNFTQTIQTDVSGRLMSVGAVATGVPVDGNPVRIAGSDTSDTRDIITDTTGRLMTVGAVADGIAVAGNPVLIGGQDGTLAQSALTDSSGRFDITSTVSGGMPVDTELPAAAALADGMTNPTTPLIGSTLLVFNSTTWDRVLEGNVAGSVLTDVSDDAARLLGVVDSITNTITVDSELTAAAALADGMTNPTTALVGSNLMVFNSTTWDRVLEGNVAGSVLVDMSDDATRDLGLVTVDGTVTADNVSGTAAEGAGVSGNPVTISGWDGASVRTLLTGVDGRLSTNMTQMNGAVLQAAAVPGDAATDAIIVQTTLGRGMVYNRTAGDWDRLNSVEAGAGLTTGLLAQGAYEYDGTNWEPKAQVIANDNTQFTTAAGATATGTAIDTFGAHPYSMINVVSSHDGNPTITIEGSPDNTNFVTLATRVAAADGTFVDTIDIPIRYIRSNCTVNAGAATVVVSYLQVPPSGADAWL